MKTTRFLNMMAASLVGVAFMSCSSQDDVLTPARQTYTMSVTAQKGGDGTRALNLDGNTLNATWTEGDVVKVYNSASTELGELTAQTAGKSTTLSGTLTTLPENGATLTLKYLSPSYSQQDGTLTGADNSIDKVCDYATATVTATVSGTNVTTGAAAFQNQQTVVKFTLVDKADGTTKLNPTAFTMTDGTSTVELTNIPAGTYTTNGGDGVLYVAFPGFTEKTITLTATVGSDTYTCTTSEAKTLENGKYYGVTAKMAKQAAAPAGAEAVDLGLSVKWANMNVGAASEGDYGQFFAWGATTDNLSASKNYQWTNTPYYTGNGTTHSWSKYTGSDKTTLDPEDDAATANWGGDWRMPTYDELNELLATKSNANYTWEWTTVGGHNGYKITNNTTGANIFLPASGGREADFLYSQGTYGNYWSSSLSEISAQEGSYLYFRSNSASMSSTYRHSGFSVRPVQGAAAPAVPAGALNGEFSVSATKTVKFSKGNLQYTKSTGKWSFMENQYDIVETLYQNVGDDYASQDVVSLFGWGTSGKTISNYGTANQPYATSTTSTAYGPSGNYNLIDTYANGDWGVNMGSGWRTLTKKEWVYLFSTRTVNGGTGSGKSYTVGQKVNDVFGVVLYPDDYTGSTYSGSNWADFENAGCVFLPVAGYRNNGTSVYGVGSNGYYWSSAAKGTDNAYGVYFGSGGVVNATFNVSRASGFSVRLVHDVE